MRSRPLRSALFVIVSSMLAIACSENVRLAVPASSISTLQTFDDRVVLAVSEADQGTDLNGDGDLADRVAHVFDIANDVTLNLAVALPPSSVLFPFSVFQDRVAVLVSEAGQGADLDADGDRSDLVLHLLGPDDVLRNTGLAVSASVLVAFDTFGGSAAVLVDEASQGRDLNGDGDLADQVIHVADFATAATQNLALALGPGRDFEIGERYLVFAVSEVAQGGVDRNGDGDAVDTGVVHVFDRAQGTTRNLGLQANDRTDFDGRFLVLEVSESAQGQDINGDGDHDDDILEVADLDAQSVQSVGLSGTGLLDNGLLRFSTFEFSENDRDLNGDGDADDLVSYVFDPATHELFETRLAKSGVDQLFGRRLLTLVSEADQGARDLNGDGDSEDRVPHVFDLDTRQVTNLAVAVSDSLSFTNADGDIAAFVVSEAGQGGQDLNGDGDVQDDILYTFDAGTGALTNTGLTVSGDIVVQGSPGRVIFRVREADMGDQNGDGDVQDTVLYVLDTTLGSVVNLGGALARDERGFGLFLFVRGDVAAFRVSEEDQGGMDLDNDGDATDEVLHRANLATGAVSNLALASTRPHIPLGADSIVFLVPEAEQGGVDRNGDGDALDLVLHVSRVPMQDAQSEPQPAAPPAL